MKVYKILGVLAAVALFAACNPCRKAQTLAVPSFAGQWWQLEAVNGSAYPFVEEANYTISFGGDGRLAGKGDCNRFFGTYTYALVKGGGKVKISPLGSTRMMCPNQSAETDFLQMLERGVSLQANGDQLTLKLPGNQTMTFRKQ